MNGLISESENILGRINENEQAAVISMYIIICNIRELCLLSGNALQNFTDTKITKSQEAIPKVENKNFLNLEFILKSLNVNNH